MLQDQLTPAVVSDFERHRCRPAVIRQPILTPAVQRALGLSCIGISLTAFIDPRIDGVGWNLLPNKVLIGPGLGKGDNSIAKDLRRLIGGNANRLVRWALLRHAHARAVLRQRHRRK